MYLYIRKCNKTKQVLINKICEKTKDKERSNKIQILKNRNARK